MNNAKNTSVSARRRKLATQAIRNAKSGNKPKYAAKKYKSIVRRPDATSSTQQRMTENRQSAYQPDFPASLQPCRKGGKTVCHVVRGIRVLVKTRGNEIDLRYKSNGQNQNGDHDHEPKAFASASRENKWNGKSGAAGNAVRHDTTYSRKQPIDAAAIMASGSSGAERRRNRPLPRRQARQHDRLHWDEPRVLHILEYRGLRE